ncbi:YqhG family protein [Psychrobacillus sp. L3]|uniref:YqhG family protein n=1 Tax=Psychrobacillus sp. L3 TaxID=3236891 RepID=UPI0036F1A184
MYPQQVHSYLQKFFQENNCDIINDNNYYITVQLTIDMDKKIMNRPYYWQYLESTNGVPNPAQLTLITDQNKLDEDIKGEIVHFGSPRLNQLFRVTKGLGAFVQMFEKIDKMETRAILTPWLGVNYKVTYYSDQTKEILYSLGINLMTGVIQEGFQESISDLVMEEFMSETVFHLPYIIKPIRALERLDAVIENIIQQDDHTWEEEATERWRKDLRVLEHFYEEVIDKPECYEMEKKAMEEQYKVRIKVEVINGGLFYKK